jgi:hypothetical protein
VSSAHSEARFLVNRGAIDANAARELIAISPEEEAALRSLIETPHDAMLVRAAVLFRRRILRRFDLLISPPSDDGLTPQEQAAQSFLLEAFERDEREEFRRQRQLGGV